jgi:hypothetical protein
MFKVLNRNLRYLFILNTAFGFTVQLVTPLFPLFLSNLGAKPRGAGGDVIDASRWSAHGQDWEKNTSLKQLGREHGYHAHAIKRQDVAAGTIALHSLQHLGSIIHARQDGHDN